LSLELWWLGQSGFRLRADGSETTVFCDPFLSVHPGRTWAAPLDAGALADEADLILVSHEHVDHFDRPTLQRAAELGARFTLVLPRPLVDDALKLGFPRERVIGAQPDETLKFGDITVHPVAACHGVNVADAYNFGQQLSNGMVRYLGYVVEIGGVRVYHAGDCIPYAGQVDRLKALRPNVALLPINGRDFFRETEDNIVGNMDEREAARLAHDIGADVLVPMHWELLPQNRGYPGDLLAYATQHFPGLTVLVMGRGARVNVLRS